MNWCNGFCDEALVEGGKFIFPKGAHNWIANLFQNPRAVARINEHSRNSEERNILAFHESRNGGVVLADAPLVEGAVAAAVVSSAGVDIHDVAKAAEEARGASKL